MADVQYVHPSTTKMYGRKVPVTAIVVQCPSIIQRIYVVPGTTVNVLYTMVYDSFKVGKYCAA